MFRKIALLFSCLFLAHPFFSDRLQAESGHGTPRFDVGPYVSTITYQEPRVMKESGRMSGVDAALVWHGGRYANLFDTIRLEGVAGRGTVDYSSSQSGTIMGIDNALFETRAIFGRDFAQKEQATFSSYTGFGYRHLSDRTGGLISSAGGHGYDRVSRYLYLPVGLGVVSQMGRGWTFESTIEYDLFLKGIQTSRLTQTSDSDYTCLNDVTNNQSYGKGMKIALRFTKDRGDKARLALEPFLNYWSIGASRDAYFAIVDHTVTPATTEQYRAWEPENNSTEVGLRVLLLF